MILMALDDDYSELPNLQGKNMSLRLFNDDFSIETMLPSVEAGSNPSTVALRIVGGDEKGITGPSCSVGI
jgi:hypothetical protein